MCSRGVSRVIHRDVSFLVGGSNRRPISDGELKPTSFQARGNGVARLGHEPRSGSELRWCLDMRCKRSEAKEGQSWTAWANWTGSVRWQWWAGERSPGLDLSEIEESCVQFTELLGREPVVVVELIDLSEEDETLPAYADGVIHVGFTWWCDVAGGGRRDWPSGWSRLALRRLLGHLNHAGGRRAIGWT